VIILLQNEGVVDVLGKLETAWKAEGSASVGFALRFRKVEAGVSANLS